MRACHLICLPAMSTCVCLYACMRVYLYLCVFSVYSVRVYERECALMHANACVCVCAYTSVFVFFVFVHMNSERECLYICMLVQNVHLCR